MTVSRLKRPKLERDQPVRRFSTLFGAPASDPARPGAARNGEHRADPDESIDDPADAPSADNGAANGRAVSETVEMGYRVIDDYLRQGQKVAEAFNPASWMGPGQNGSPDEIQKIAQRVMQYGWDFAGMWFEMWTRMAGNGGWPPGFPMPGMPATSASHGRPGSTVSESPPGSDEASGSEPVRLEVDVRSARPTKSSLDLRPGPTHALVLQRLRPATGEGPSIDDASIERVGEGGALTVKVVVAREQPAGVYNAIILDASTNLPRGTLSISISDELPEGSSEPFSSEGDGEESPTRRRKRDSSGKARS
jgi:hypothetical protein